MRASGTYELGLAEYVDSYGIADYAHVFEEHGDADDVAAGLHCDVVFFVQLDADSLSVRAGRNPPDMAVDQLSRGPLVPFSVDLDVAELVFLLRPESKGSLAVILKIERECGDLVCVPLAFVCGKPAAKPLGGLAPDGFAPWVDAEEALLERKRPDAALDCQGECE